MTQPWSTLIAVAVGLGIVWVALLYSADGSVKRLLRPFIRLTMPVMKAFAATVGFILQPVALFAKFIFTKLRPKPVDVVD